MSPNNEKINSSSVSRVLRLRLLAPDIVEVILDGRQPGGVTLPELMVPLPVEWGGNWRPLRLGQRVLPRNPLRTGLGAGDDRAHSVTGETTTQPKVA